MTFNKFPPGGAYARGVVSSANASTTLLTNGSSYTGSWEDVSGYDSLTVAVATDQDGYYSVQFSPDGTNTDSTLTRYYRTALINPPHRFTITRKYARIVFTNDSGSDQTYLRLQVLLGDKEQLNVPLGGTVSNDYDAAVVRAAEYHHDVARGLWQGRENWHKFGYNADIASAAPEVLWPNGAAFDPSTILSSASTFTVVSSATTDNASGTGARSLIFYYIDANGIPATGTHAMHATDGTVSTVTSFSGLGINRVAVLSSGSSAYNDGNITITNTTGGAQAAYVSLQDSVTQQCIFYNPYGYTGLVNGVYISAAKLAGGTAPRITVDGFVYNVPTTSTRYRVFSQFIDTSVENDIFQIFAQPFALSSGDVFWLQATTNTNATSVAARFTLTANRLMST